MNIFALDTNPTICAQYHCNKHLIKMIVEHLQLISTAHRVLDGVQVKSMQTGGRSKVLYRFNDEREDRLCTK